MSRHREEEAGRAAAGVGTGAVSVEPSAPPRRRRLRLAAALLAALLALAAAAHLLWWAWPRPHAALPDPDDLPGRLLAGGRLPAALWIAYPHQNLAVLADRVGREDGAEAWLAALGRRTDLPATELPAFGPFAAPPSRELAVLSDLAGERVVIAARVEPVFAALSRLAGLVAGNPWLAGGEVEAFGGRAEVAWRGTLWIATNLPLDEVLAMAEEGGAAGSRGEAAPLAEPALAALRLDRPLSLLPAGVHALRAADDGLRLATEGGAAGAAEGGIAPFPGAGAGAGGAAADLPDELLSRWGVSLLVLSGRDGPAGGAGAFALFRDTGGAKRLGPLTFELPAAAVWHRAGGGRFALPGEGLLGFLGGDGGRAGAWRITATGGEAEGRARALAPALEPLLARLRLALWADPRPALHTVEDVADFLDAVPLAGREESRRWRDWQILLAPLAACDRLALATSQTRVDLTIAGCVD
jgi:hypothetical protein